MGPTEAREDASFRAIRTHPAERCRNRTATPIPALTMLGDSIPSPCMLLIVNYLCKSIGACDSKSDSLSNHVHYCSAGFRSTVLTYLIASRRSRSIVPAQKCGHR
jgi:hypothetical protein